MIVAAEILVSVVSDFANCVDGETTGTGVTEFSMTESASERMDESTWPVYIADPEAVVKEDSRKITHKRRRFTGKAVKHSTIKQETGTAIRTVGTSEGLALGSACEALGGESHVPEHVKASTPTTCHSFVLGCPKRRLFQLGRIPCEHGSG